MSSLLDILYSTSIDDYIAHHGIKGQKWGVKHGPPYPLGRKISTGKALRGSGKSSALKTGLVKGLKAVIPTALIKPKQLVKEEKDIIANSTLDKNTGLYKKTRQYSREEDIALVNKANYDADVPGSGTNCVLCSMTYELRRRGYNCKAKTLPNDTGVGASFELQTFKGAKFSKSSPLPYPTSSLFSNEKYTNAYRILSLRARKGQNTELYNQSVSVLSQEKNTRGVFFVNFGYYGGHAIAYEVNGNGKVTFIDTQNGQIYDEPGAKKLLSYGVATRYMRLDDKEMNVDFLKENVIYEPQDKSSKMANIHNFDYYEKKYVNAVSSKKVDVTKAAAVNDAIKKARKG